jgi:hypothetical protein
MNGTIKEFTKKEFDAFIAKNGYETFTADQVLKFNQEVINNQNSMDEFSKSCAAADFVSLNRAIVVDNDLVKSVVYYRECQIEPLEKEEFGSIMKSKQVVFADTALNRFKGIVGLPVNNDVIEKARKAEPIGAEKTFGGKLYIKTEKGWRLKPKGSKKGSEKTEKELDKKKNEPKQEKKKEASKGEDFEEAMEKFSEMFYDGESSEKLKRYLDSRLGEGTYDRILKETSSRRFEESSTRKDYFMGRVEDAFLNNYSNKAKNSSEHQEKETQKRRKEKVPFLRRRVTAAQYKDRKDEIIGEIAKERLKLMNKYGDNWQDDASSKDLERLSSLVSRVNKLGENFNQFGDKSKNSSEHQMTEVQMRAYATARDPKAKEIAKLEGKK